MSDTRADLRLAFIPTGMVLRTVMIGSTRGMAMIEGVVAVRGLSKFEQGRRICWPYDPDDWAEVSDGATAA